MSTLNLTQCHTIILSVFSSRGGIELARSALQSDTPEDPPEDNLPWCVCGKCRPMPMPVENVCCMHYIH